jgi:hypothetical protein
MSAGKEAPGEPFHAGPAWLNRLLVSRLGDSILGTRRGLRRSFEGSAAKEYSEQLTREIATEHGLVAARMTWNLTFQGFLFAAYALGSSRPAQNPQVDVLLETVPVAGLVTAGLTLLGIGAAWVRINSLKRSWYANELDFQAFRPRPFSHPLGTLLGRFPPLGITAVLIWCWANIRWPGWLG